MNEEPTMTTTNTASTAVVPQISIRNCTGFSVVEAADVPSGALKVGEFWDSPIDGKEMDLFGCVFSREKKVKTSLLVVAGDGSKTQWTVYAPSPGLFMADNERPWAKYAEDWTGYTEVPGIVSGQELATYYDDRYRRCSIQAAQIKVVWENGVAKAIAPKIHSFATESQPVTWEGFEVLVEAEMTAARPDRQFSVFEVVTLTYREVSRVIYRLTRERGKAPIIFGTLEEMLQAAETAATPAVKSFAKTIDAFREAINEDDSHASLTGQFRFSSTGGGKSHGTAKYSFSSGTGTMLRVDVTWHRGEVSSIAPYGLIEFFWDLPCLVCGTGLRHNNKSGYCSEHAEHRPDRRNRKPSADR